GKWFGKAWQSVKSTTGSIYNQTKQKYSDASDKAWAHSKSIWRGTSKWFSNAYKSAKGWLIDMANKSRSKWDNILVQHGRMQNPFGKEHRNGLVTHTNL
ncbi:hypothetical protein NG726_33670, partial [Pseudomonas sp. MOB-449]|nr:hypothetical protein [Pseudomonas sp. MOB-449]